MALGWEKSQLSRRIVLAGLILLMIWPLYGIIERGLVVSRPNTRQLAKEWIEANIPGGSRLIVCENGPPLLLNEQAIRRIYPDTEEGKGSGQFTTHYKRFLDVQLEAAKEGITYDVEVLRFPWWREAELQAGVHTLTSEYDQDMANPLKPVGVNTYQHYVDEGVDYAIVHSDAYLACLDRASTTAERFPSFAAFYRDLFAHGHLVRTISSKEGLLPGPEVRVYSLQQNP